ncbi:hypothetical protein P154DRAFT_216778 [Amniculicola lignicola CBS 123094]|uniref:Uncharacterized protein n=1 Tax=Amniculicola lignicola CBS 123094 TaxID=1392246 RepID=A0A6A5WE02_9PLEO|nr:hypothetical protein P154DRAFT_216778 [Amniculicola lignicola CBS 123094]
MAHRCLLLTSTFTVTTRKHKQTIGWASHARRSCCQRVRFATWLVYIRHCCCRVFNPLVVALPPSLLLSTTRLATSTADMEFPAAAAREQRLGLFDDAGVLIPKKHRDTSDHIPGHKMLIHISGLHGIHDVRTGIAYWYRGHYLYALNGGPIEPVEYPVKSKIFVKNLPMSAAPPYDPFDPTLVYEHELSVIACMKQNISSAKPVVGMGEPAGESQEEIDGEDEGQDAYQYEAGYLAHQRGSAFDIGKPMDGLQRPATPPVINITSAQLFSPHDRAHYLAESAPVSVSGSLAGSRTSSPVPYHAGLRPTASMIGMEHLHPVRHHRKSSSSSLQSHMDNLRSPANQAYHERSGSTSSLPKLSDPHPAGGLRSVASASALERLRSEEGFKRQRPRSALGVSRVKGDGDIDSDGDTDNSDQSAARKSVQLDKIVDEDEDEPLIPSSVSSNVNLKGLKRTSSVNPDSKLGLQRTASLNRLKVPAAPLLGSKNAGPASASKSPTKFALGDDTDVEAFPSFSHTNLPQISRGPSPMLPQNVASTSRPAYPGLGTSTRTRRLSSVRGNRALNEMYNRKHQPMLSEHDSASLGTPGASGPWIPGLGAPVDAAGGAGLGSRSSSYGGLGKLPINTGLGSSSLKRGEQLTRSSSINPYQHVAAGENTVNPISGPSSAFANYQHSGYVFGTTFNDGQTYLTPNFPSHKKGPVVREQPKPILKCVIHGEDCDGETVTHEHVTLQVGNSRGFRELYPSIEAGGRKMVDWAKILQEEKQKMGL